MASLAPHLIILLSCTLLFPRLLLSQTIDYSKAYEYYLKGEPEKSAVEYLSIANLNPRDARPLLDAAIIYKQIDQPYKAIQVLEKARELEPDNPDILVELGWIKFHEADYINAALDFENALRINPFNTRALLGLGSVYANLGRKNEAIQYLKKYQELRPNFAGVDYIIAWNYGNFKMFKEAEISLIEALKKDPTFIEARLPLAGIYVREHKFNEAWNQYYRVLDYAPNHPIASRMVRFLQGRLTKQPEEIRPPMKVLHPPRVELTDVVRKLGKSVRIRIGIGTTKLGKVFPNKNLRFKSFDGFKIIGKLTRNVYAWADSDSAWTASFENDKIVIRNPDGVVYGRFKGPILLVPKSIRTSTIVLERIKNSTNPWFAGSDREYRGIIELYPVPSKGIGIVNIVDMELYLLGVVPSEVMSWWPTEVLKSQAVIARTQVIIRSLRGGPHRNEGYHLCDGQHCQVYKGALIESNSTNKAVLDTQGEILTYHGKPVYTFYHANCGGYIQSSGEVAGWGDSPYLGAHQDQLEDRTISTASPWKFHLWIMDNPPANCNYPGMVSSSQFRWLRIIKHKDMEYKINKEYDIGSLRKIIPLKRSRSGNVNSIMIAGSRRTVTITKEHLIRNILGFGPVKSTMFVIETNKHKNGRTRNYWIYGGGWGHGVGLCQSGAAGLAGKYKKNYREILKFYYPGTHLRKLKYVRKK
jgi:SpoIID/LytB domain protein